jgi:AcrR family transcriptional regulator
MPEPELNGARSGRRAQHKQRTRDAIKAAAMRLFFAHGYDSVTVAQVADAAGVSVATVFNYFDTKEDLFFDEVEPLATDLVRAVRDCPPGASVLQALRAQLEHQLLGGRTEEAHQEVAAFHAAIEHSAALQGREQEIQLYRRQLLAETIAATLDAQPPTAAAKPAPAALAQLAAAQYLTVEHIVAGRLRALLSDGTPMAAALSELAPLADQLFAAVRDGLGPLPKARPGLSRTPSEEPR